MAAAETRERAGGMEVAAAMTRSTINATAPGGVEATERSMDSDQALTVLQAAADVSIAGVETEVIAFKSEASIRIGV